MEKLDSLNQVADFHRTFQHPIQPTPTIPSEQRCALRVNLLQEELNELKQAIADGDLVEIADALCDIQYVLSGAVLEFGMGDAFKTLFDEVQRSNMSKTCNSLEEAEATKVYYEEERSMPAYIKQQGDVWLVFRQSDDKTLKSINYSPADLKGKLQGFVGEQKLS